MDIDTAYALIATQNARLKSLHGTRFSFKGYEYEIRYEGGFTSFMCLYRREIGKRRFKYFNGRGCYDCLGAATAFAKLKELLP